MWPEFGLAVFSPFLCKIKCVFGTNEKKDIVLLRDEQFLENSRWHLWGNTVFYKSTGWSDTLLKGVLQNALLLSVHEDAGPQ